MITVISFKVFILTLLVRKLKGFLNQSEKMEAFFYGCVIRSMDIITTYYQSCEYKISPYDGYIITVRSDFDVYVSFITIYTINCMLQIFKFIQLISIVLQLNRIGFSSSVASQT